MHDHDSQVEPFLPAAVPDGISEEDYHAQLRGTDTQAATGWPRKKTKTAVHPALILVLGGAPDSPHTLVGNPGYYRPTSPTPTGGPGEPTVEHALELAADPGAPVALVYLTDKQLDQARERHAHDLAQARNGVLAARPHATPAEAETIADELDAQKGA